MQRPTRALPTAARTSRSRLRLRASSAARSGRRLPIHSSARTRAPRSSMPFNAGRAGSTPTVVDRRRVPQLARSQRQQRRRRRGRRAASPTVAARSNSASARPRSTTTLSNSSSARKGRIDRRLGLRRVVASTASPNRTNTSAGFTNVTNIANAIDVVPIERRADLPRMAIPPACRSICSAASARSLAQMAATRARPRSSSSSTTRRSRPLRSAAAAVRAHSVGSLPGRGQLRHGVSRRARRDRSGRVPEARSVELSRRRRRQHSCRSPVASMSDEFFGEALMPVVNDMPGIRRSTSSWAIAMPTTTSAGPTRPTSTV